MKIFFETFQQYGNNFMIVIFLDLTFIFYEVKLKGPDICLLFTTYFFMNLLTFEKLNFERTS